MEPIYFTTSRHQPGCAGAAQRPSVHDGGDLCSTVLPVRPGDPRRRPPTGRRRWPRPWAARPGKVISPPGGTEGGQLGHLWRPTPGGRHPGQLIITTAVEALRRCWKPTKALAPCAPGHLLTPAPTVIREAALRSANGAGVYDAGEQRDRGHPAVKEAGQVLERRRSQALLHTDAVIQGFLQ